MKTTNKLIILLCSLLTLVASAYAQSPREELRQMTEQLQRTPNDNALREQIIKLALEVQPAPTISKEARRSFVMAGTFQQTAKTPEDFGSAINAYMEALALAPWWGDAYYNLSVSLESAGRYDEARNALMHYLLGKPADAEQAEDRLYALEARAAVAAQEKVQKARTLIVPGVSVGEIRVGMTEAEAINVLGAPIDRFDYDNKNGYRGVNLTWGVRPETIYMNFHKYQPTDFINTGQPRFMTSEGVGPGMPIAQALALLGSPTKSKDYGTIMEICYARGVILGRNAGSTKVDYVVVFQPASINKLCPD